MEPEQSERSALRRRSTVRAANCSACRHTGVPSASKSRFRAAPGATKLVISASIAGPNSCAQAFITRVRPVGAEFEAGVAMLFADLDQRGGQAPQALALFDLGLGAGGVGGGDGTRGLLAVAIEEQGE